MARVTSETFAERLLRSVEQAAAIKQGNTEPARLSRRKLTAQKTMVAEPPRYDKARVAALRSRLNVSQPVLAGLLNVKTATIRAWEQGLTPPSGAARRLLQIIEEYPELVAPALQAKE